MPKIYEKEVLYNSMVSSAYEYLSVLNVWKEYEKSFATVRIYNEKHKCKKILHNYQYSSFQKEFDKDTRFQIISLHFRHEVEIISYNDVWKKFYESI